MATAEAAVAGRRADVPVLMRAAMDVLVMPSLFEGLPVTLIESQAAGLPALVSTRVSDEVDVVGELVDRLPLEAAPASWAKRAVGLAKRRADVPAAAALASVEESPLEIGRSLETLTAAYRARLGVTPGAAG